MLVVEGLAFNLQKNPPAISGKHTKKKVCLYSYQISSNGIAPVDIKAILFLDMDTKPRQINVPICINQQTHTFINSMCLEKKEAFWYCTVGDMETQEGYVLLSNRFYLQLVKQIGCIWPAVVLGLACPLLLPFLKLLLLVNIWEIAHKNHALWLSLRKWKVVANQTLLLLQQSSAGAEQQLSLCRVHGHSFQFVIVPILPCWSLSSQSLLFYTELS